MRNVNCVILSAVDTASQNGSLVDANQLVSASFQAVFGDASAVGVFKIQASNDVAPARNMATQDGFAPTNWTDIPNATVAISAGGTAIITIAQMTYRWVRAVYTRTSDGSTTVVVSMNALSC